MFQKPSTLKKSLHWCFLCVCSRCLIYKVHAAFQRAFILPNPLSFVKNFFRLHRRSFHLLRRKPRRICSVLAAAALADSLFRLPHPFALVKLFFRFFEVFRTENRSWSLAPPEECDPPSLKDSLISLPRRPRIVKHFFRPLHSFPWAPAVPAFPCSKGARL